MNPILSRMIRGLSRGAKLAAFISPKLVAAVIEPMMLFRLK